MSLHKLTSIPLLLLGAAILSSPNLHAGASNKSGNPYGNSSYFPNGGTYSAICRGPNAFLAGVTFSTSTTNFGGTNNSTNANSGVSTVYAGGQQYLGTAAGFSDPGSGTVAATYIAYFTFSETVGQNSNSVVTNTTTNNVTIPQTNTVQEYITNVQVLYTTSPVYLYNTNGVLISQTNLISPYTVPSNPPTLVTITNVSNTLTSSIVQTYITNVNTAYQTNIYTNWVSGQFSAQIQNNYPNQTFSGSGEAYGINYFTTNTTVYTNTVTGTLVDQGTVE